MTNLNPQQKEELIESYVELIVDSMDTKDLVRYVSSDMTEFLETLTNSELKDEISLTMDGEVWDELVENVGGQV
jgi:hypothetical protein|tara:strand:+ start:87 stop:308 length:222 start_codon:yes stop_codon:yes gene_type:complete